MSSGLTKVKTFPKLFIKEFCATVWQTFSFWLNESYERSTLFSQLIKPLIKNVCFSNNTPTVDQSDKMNNP